jgi:hypothetical protein
VDSVWEQYKPEAKETLENAGESHAILHVGGEE